MRNQTTSDLLFGLRLLIVALVTSFIVQLGSIYSEFGLVWTAIAALAIFFVQGMVICPQIPKFVAVVAICVSAVLCAVLSII